MLTSSDLADENVIRNGGTHRFGARIISTTITTRSTRIATGVLARSVTNWISCVDHATAWSLAQPPTLASSLVR